MKLTQGLQLFSPLQRVKIFWKITFEVFSNSFFWPNCVATRHSSRIRSRLHSSPRRWRIQKFRQQRPGREQRVPKSGRSWIGWKFWNLFLVISWSCVYNVVYPLSHTHTHKHTHSREHKQTSKHTHTQAISHKNKQTSTCIQINTHLHFWVS